MLVTLNVETEKKTTEEKLFVKKKATYVTGKQMVE